MVEKIVRLGWLKLKEMLRWRLECLVRIIVVAERADLVLVRVWQRLSVPR